MPDYLTPAHQPQRQRIALLCDSLEDEFQSALVNAALDTANQLQFDLLIVPGGKLGNRQARTFIYELVHARWADGFIVAANTIGHQAPRSLIEQFIARFRNVPTVVLGTSTDSGCSLVVDNRSAALELTRHLTLEHAYKRLGFVGGPPENPEAHARLAGFQAGLREAGLELLPQLYVEGNFTKESGERAIETLLEARQLAVSSIDALVFANDAMAVGGYRALEQRGHAVPTDIGLAGFDDLEHGRHLPAPLTTVRQPLHDILRKAASSLLTAIANGSKPSGEIAQPMQLITRRSCGCSRKRSDRRSSVPHIANVDLVTAVTARLPLIRQDLDANFASTLDELKPTWLEDLCAALVTQLEKAGSLAFYDRLESLCFELLRHNKPIAGWQPTLLLMRRYIASGGLPNLGTLQRLENLLDGSLLLVSEMATSFVTRQREELLERLRALSDTTSTLLTAPDMQTVAKAVTHHLPRLGIGSALVSIFEDDARCIATPIAAIESGQEHTFSSYPATHLGPDSLLRGRHWVVEPLGLPNEALGIALLECGLAQASWYERLNDALSAAIKGARLIREVKEAQERVTQLAITDPLTGLNNRRYLAEKIRSELATASSSARPTSLLVLDLDGFKSLNDAYGHDHGDRALVLVAEVLKDCLRENDGLARFGGDEFVAVLSNASADAAEHVAQRVLSELPVLLRARLGAPVTCSIGIATSEVNQPFESTELFKQADQALLAAKSNGKNRAIHAQRFAA